MRIRRVFEDFARYFVYRLEICGNWRVEGLCLYFMLGREIQKDLSQVPAVVQQSVRDSRRRDFLFLPRVVIIILQPSRAQSDIALGEIPKKAVL